MVTRHLRPGIVAVGLGLATFGFLAGTAAAAQQFTLSGTVTNSDGTGIPGVWMNGLPGNQVLTQADGSYTATVNTGWSGTVTPIRAGYTFTPPSNTYANVTGNRTGNYTASAASGTPWAWGYDHYGQLGNNSTTNCLEPVQVNNLTGVVALAGGWIHSLAIGSGGAVWAWGDNTYGELGDNKAEANALVPIQVHNLTGVTAIAAAGGLSLALKSDQTVWAWGSNSQGQLGDKQAEGQAPEPVQVHKLTGVTAIAAGGGSVPASGFSLALKSDGTVWAWGDNSYGQLGDNQAEGQALDPIQVPSLTNVVAISAGSQFALALKSDGTVWAWGDNGSGNLGDNSKTTRLVPVQVHSLASVIGISAGWDHSLALKSDGTVWAWGYNASGGLGDNRAELVALEPVQTHNLPNGVVAVAAAMDFSLALKGNGTVWAWGANDFGNLGDNTQTERDEPVQVVNLSGVLAIAAGWNYGLAIAGSPQQFTISGSVKDAGGTAIPGVTMSGLPGNPATQPDGSYTATVDTGWSGTVTPTMAGYTFTPPTKTYSNVTVSQTDNYTGNPLPKFTISGSVKTAGGVAIPVVTMSGLPGNPTTNSKGSYSGTVTSGWSGTVTPTLAGYKFTPISKSYTNVKSDQTQDYTAAQLAPALEVQSSGDLDFGPVPVGSWKTMGDAYTLTNTGGGTLKVTVSVPAPFHVLNHSQVPVNPLVFSLAAGAEKQLAFEFAPLAAGAVSKAISFSSNGGNNATHHAKGVGILPVVGIAWTQDASEPKGKQGIFTLTATLPAGLSQTAIGLKVPYTVSGTARNGTNYTLSPASPVPLTIPAGKTTGTATVTVTPKDDETIDPNRTVILTLGTGMAYGLDPQNKSATVKILENLPTPTVTITSCPPSVAHGGKVTVAWTISPGTAMKLNRVEWGTVQDKFPNVTASTLTSQATYQATFNAPTTASIPAVYLKVHMTTSGGVECPSTTVPTVSVK